MLPVLIQSLLLASSGLIFVGSITLVILLLLSDRGWRNGVGYALGYISGYSLIGITVVLLGYKATEKSSNKPSFFLPILLLSLGILLLVLAFRNWRKSVSENQGDSRFFSIVDKITPPKAFGFGALVSVINFKNLALFLTALSVIVISDLSITDKITITMLVVVVFCLSVIIPVVIYLCFPRRARKVLNSIKHFLNQHSRTIGIWALFIFGIILLIKGISELL